MKLITKVRNLALCLALGGAGCQTLGIEGSGELRVGRRATTADIQASSTIAGRIGIFARSQTRATYDVGTIQNFAYADASAEIAGGFAPVIEGQMFVPDIGHTNPELSERVGIQYTGTIGPVNVFSIVTARLDNLMRAERRSDLEAVAALDYSIDSVRIATELVTNRQLSDGQHNFSYGRLQLQFTQGELRFGPFVEAEMLGRNNPTYNAGVGVQIMLP